MTFRPLQLLRRTYFKLKTIFCPLKLLQRKYIKIRSIFGPSNQTKVRGFQKSTLKVREYFINWIFCISKLRWTKHVEITQIYCPFKLLWTKHCQATWIFHWSNIRHIKNVKATRIFRPSKFTWKKYIKTKWKIISLIFSTYQCNSDIKSTLIWVFCTHINKIA